MKTSAWIPYAVCAVVGVVGALAFRSLRGPSAPVEEAVNQVALVQDSVKVPVAPPPVAKTVPLPPVARPAEVVKAAPPPSAPSEVFLNEARQYAASFQGGVYQQGGIPEFASRYFFPTGKDEAAALTEYDSYAREIIDPWSSDMERRLRAFFEVQPEISRTRMSISCRTTQCMMHMTDVGPLVAVTPEVTMTASIPMMMKLQHEKWYVEQFLAPYNRGSTPMEAEARYRLMVLPRRQK